MVTLVDLYTEIDTNPLTISRVETDDIGSQVTLDIAYILDAVENEARDVSITVYIKDRGGAGEAAYYRRKPPYLRSTTFRDAIITAITTYQGANASLEEYEFIKLSETEKFAVMKVFWETAGDSEVRYYFVWEDGLSAIQIRRVTNYTTAQ